jgi:hypothetical protein
MANENGARSWGKITVNAKTLRHMAEMQGLCWPSSHFMGVESVLLTQTIVLFHIMKFCRRLKVDNFINTSDHPPFQGHTQHTSRSYSVYEAEGINDLYIDQQLFRYLADKHIIDLSA